MKTLQFLTFAALSGAFIATFPYPRPCQAQTLLPPLKIVLAGDSTVAPNGGWGRDSPSYSNPKRN